MKALLKLFKGPIKKWVIKELEKDELKTLAISTLNEKLDLPKLSEAEEKKLLDAIYDASVEAVATAIERI